MKDWLIVKTIYVSIKADFLLSILSNLNWFSADNFQLFCDFLRSSWFQFYKLRSITSPFNCTALEDFQARKIQIVHFVSSSLIQSTAVEPFKLCKNLLFLDAATPTLSQSHHWNEEASKRTEDLFCLKIELHWGTSAALAFAWQCHCLWDGLANMQSCNPAILQSKSNQQPVLQM